MSNLEMILALEELDERQAKIVRALAARLAELGDTETARDEIALADRAYRRLIGAEEEPFALGADDAEPLPELLERPEGGAEGMNLETVYSYHAPKEGQAEHYTKIRAKARELAELITTECPDSREKSQAFLKLEECVMWANASIARNE
jgi:hypothetical protein